MIDRQKGCVLVVCDDGGCDEIFEGKRGVPFKEVWAAAKKAGWTIKRLDDETWAHGCPDHPAW